MAVASVPFVGAQRPETHVLFPPQVELHDPQCELLL